MSEQTYVKSSPSPEVGEVCAACGRVITRLEQPFIHGDNVLCFGCYRHAHDPQAPGSDPAKHVLFFDSRIQVTQRLLTIGRAQYSLAAVRFARLQKLPARRMFPNLIASAGAVTALVTTNFLQQPWTAPFPLISSALFALGLVLALVTRPRYQILLTDLQGERIVFTSRRRRYTSRLLAAIAQAIVERGQMIDPAALPIASPSPRHHDSAHFAR